MSIMVFLMGLCDELSFLWFWKDISLDLVFIKSDNEIGLFIGWWL